MSVSKKTGLILITLFILMPMSANADIKIIFGSPYAYKHSYNHHYYPSYRYNKHNYYRNNRHRNYYSNNRYNTYYRHYPKKYYYAPYVNNNRHHQKHHAYEQGFYDSLKHKKSRKQQYSGKR